VLLGTRAVPSLAPGASDNATVTLTLPAGRRAGTQYILAIADGDGADRRDAGGQQPRQPQHPRRRRPAGVELHGAHRQRAGLTIVLTDTTRNAGGGTAPASTTSYYLSADTLLDASDVLLGSRAVPALAAGALDTASVTVTIPAGTATGNWNVFARADSGSVVSETYENNNLTSRALRVGPDMNISSLSAPASVAVGAAFSVTDTTRNAGGGAAPATTTRYYLSTNGVPDAGDVLLGSRPVPALGPGGTDTATVSLTIPAGTATGSYFLIAVADGDGVVVETVETNNFANRGVTVTP
jgi:subtilase family serine protease